MPKSIVDRLAAVINEYSERHKITVASHENARKAMKEEHANELASLNDGKRDLETKLKEMQDKHEANLQDREKKWGNERAELMSKHTSDVDKLKEEIKESCKNAKQTLDEERVKLKSEHEKEITQVQERVQNIQQELETERESFREASEKSSADHQAELREWKEKHEQTEQELKDVNQKWKDLKEEVLLLKNEVDKMTQERKDLESDGHKQKLSFEDQLAKSTTKTEGLEHEVSTQKAMVQKLTQRLEEETKLKTELQEQLNDMVATKEQQPKLEDIVADLKLKEEELETVREQLQATEERLKEQETKREESQRNLETMQKTMKELQSHSSKSAADLGLYFEQVTSLCEKLSLAESDSKQKEKEMEKLKGIIESAEKIEEEYLQATTMLSAAEDELKLLRKNIPATLQAEDQAIAGSVKNVKEDTHVIEGLKRQVTDLMEKVKARDEELHQLKSKQGDNPLSNPPFSPTESMQASSGEVQALKLSLKEKEQELQNLQTQIHSMEADLQEREQLKKDSNELKEEITKLTREKETLREHTKKQSQMVLVLKQQQQVLYIINFSNQTLSVSTFFRVVDLQLQMDLNIPGCFQMKTGNLELKLPLERQTN